MKKTLPILFFLLSLLKTALSQDFPYGSVSDEVMAMKKYDKDTSAHAVVLREFGKTSIEKGIADYVDVVHEYHVKIKIFDAKGFGTIEIPAYNFNEDGANYEKVDEITGVTFFKDENGGTQKIDLDYKTIYMVEEGNNLKIYKFAMPGIKNGCVIEYKYKLTSPYFENLHPWYFQSYIPKIYSENEVHIPSYWRYNASLTGNLKLTKHTSDVELNCLIIGPGSAYTPSGVSCSLFVFGMSDIPAFISEDNMTSDKNFLSAIKFELVEYTNPFTDVKTKEPKQWKDVDYNLKGYLYFGKQLKKQGLFKDRIVPVTFGKTDNLSIAKSVYSYIKQLFKWDDFYGKYSEYGISIALDKHSGNDADINFSLVDALNATGLNAKAVLLSTRDHGTINPFYPVVDDFNYVIAMVDIDGQQYLLDATDPLLPFGVLPLRCLNGKGHVFNTDSPSGDMDINPPQKKKSTRTLDLILQDNGILKGSLIYYSSGYDAYLKRQAIKKFNTTDEYVDDFSSKSPRIKVLKSEIINLDSLDNPLIEKYELEINISDKLNGNSLAFNPFFWGRLENNPFKLSERSYPVDLGMPSDERLVLTIHLPPQYTVEAPPQIFSLGIPGNGGKFITNYEPGENSFSFSHIIQLNKPVYDSGEYPYLKELYNKIVQSEKAEIIFKKK